MIGVEDDFSKEKLLELYRWSDAPMMVTNRRSAEMIKYASNDFLALKISYINEIANLCEAIVADIKDVAKGMSYDSRIGDKFLNKDGVETRDILSDFVHPTVMGYEIWLGSVAPTLKEWLK